ncbi:hypothetical protein [Burkholderia ubonensis]|uniref:hypothetical protein n=1 Tax=Burkholderia ubonensis TaxID=101571 RepID=UPI0018DFC98A|nr:hypothetical protein [Burkholderia ubonensis]
MTPIIHGRVKRRSVEQSLERGVFRGIGRTTARGRPAARARARRSARDERIGAEAAGMVGAVRAPLRERRHRADVRDEGGQRALRTAGTARTALESWILINR